MCAALNHNHREGQLVVSSFLQQNDFADLSRVMRKNNLVKKSLKHFGMAQPPRASQQLRLLELRLAIDQCRRSRLFLELAHFFRLMRISRIGSRYDLSKYKETMTFALRFGTRTSVHQSTPRSCRIGTRTASQYCVAARPLRRPRKGILSSVRGTNAEDRLSCR